MWILCNLCLSLIFFIDTDSESDDLVNQLCATALCLLLDKAKMIQEENARVEKELTQKESPSGKKK